MLGRGQARTFLLGFARAFIGVIIAVIEFQLCLLHMHDFIAQAV